MAELIPLLKEPPPKKRGSRKLILILVLLFLILLSILFFNSAISKVSAVTVSGEQFTPEAVIKEAASVRPGDAFFGTVAGTVEKRVDTLGSIKRTTVEKKFPGEVRIIVEEYPPVAFEMDDAGKLSAILASGKILEADAGSAVVDKPVLSGWRKDDPVKKKLCEALADIRAEDLDHLSEISPSPTESYPDRIRIYTRSGFEIVTAVSLLKDKLPTINSVVEERSPGRATLLLADTYMPFGSAEESADEGSAGGSR